MIDEKVISVFSQTRHYKYYLQLFTAIPLTITEAYLYSVSVTHIFSQVHQGYGYEDSCVTISRTCQYAKIHHNTFCRLSRQYTLRPFADSLLKESVSCLKLMKNLNFIKTMHLTSYETASKLDQYAMPECYQRS